MQIDERKRERGGMGLIACIVSFQLMALIILPIMIFCYQVMLYDNTVDQLELAAEIASYDILGNITASDYSEQISFEKQDVTTLFKERLLGALNDQFDADDFRNISAVLSFQTLSVSYEYHYKEAFLKRDKWLLCAITYTLPVNN